MRERGEKLGERDRIVLSIALFHFAKAALMTAAGFAALHLLRPGVAEAVMERVADLPVEGEHRIVQRGLAWLLGGGPRRVQLLGATAFGYATLFSVEGVGLWLQKRWAEVLVIIATSSLLPLEIYAVIRLVTLIRIAILIINMAIVAYLIRRIRAVAA